MIPLPKSVVGGLVKFLTAGSAFLTVSLVAWIMLNIVIGGWHDLTWSFLFSDPEQGMTEGGIFPAIIGTFFLVIIMSAMGVPVGTLTAIYLSEYVGQHSRLGRWIRFAVNTLAGIPAIVFGLFGLGFFIQFVGGGMDKAFSGGKLVLPNSMTGILTGGILAVSRGAGEVAPILFTGAAYFLPNLPTAFTDQFMELGYHIYIMSTQSPNVEETRGIQYATTLVLLLLTFTLNFSAIFLRYHMRKRRISL